MTHICVSKLTIIGSDNGLSPDQRQAIIWTNAGILLTGPLGTKFSEILIEIHAFSFKKLHLKMSYAKWRLFGLGLNELNPLLKAEYSGRSRSIQWFLTPWFRALPGQQQPQYCLWDIDIPIVRGSEFKKKTTPFLYTETVWNVVEGISISRAVSL